MLVKLRITRSQTAPPVNPALHCKVHALAPELHHYGESQKDETFFAIAPHES